MRINKLLAVAAVAATLPLIGACAHDGNLGMEKSEIKELIASDKTSQESFDTVMAFMGAMGSGDMETMGSLMADDMVWHNEGDTTLPWIGETKGKENIFEFLGVFSSNLKTTKWENLDAFASGDTVAVFGVMNGVTTKSNQEIGDFTFALRAKVKDGQVVLWHWFEDSFAVSQAYHGKNVEAAAE